MLLFLKKHFKMPKPGPYLCINIIVREYRFDKESSRFSFESLQRCIKTVFAKFYIHIL